MNEFDKKIVIADINSGRIIQKEYTTQVLFPYNPLIHTKTLLYKLKKAYAKYLKKHNSPIYKMLLIKQVEKL